MEDMTIAFRCPVKLAEKIDAYIENGEYMNRGDAGRDLVRLGLHMKEESDKHGNRKASINCNCFAAGEETV